jgi:N-acetylglucosaminyldiphosphoundecaprenol N-acetyl-beta-D-mannosaminyltransferase
MRLIAIVTVDQEEGTNEEFGRLLESGRDFVDVWSIAVRTDSEEVFREIAQNVGERNLEAGVIITRIRPAGASVARNAAIGAYFERHEGEESDYFSFPDDDCFFPVGFGDKLREVIQETRTDVLVLPYSPANGQILRSRWPEWRGTPTPRQIVAVVGTAGTFMRSTLPVIKQGFDPNLGTGGPRHSAEDTEFVLRARRGGASVFYDGTFGLHHPYRPTPPRRIVGNLSVATAYARDLGIVAVARTWGRATLLAWKHRTEAWPLTMVPLALTYKKSRIYAINSLLAKRNIAELEICVLPPNDLAEIAASWFDEPPTTVKTIYAGHVTSINSSPNPKFQQHFNEADIAMVDGISLSLISLLTPGPVLEKMATTDFAPLLFERGAATLGRRLRLAVVGGPDDLAARAGHAAEEQFPVDLVYSSNGYRKDTGVLLAEVSATSPDVLLVGMGMPLEAIWVGNNKESIDATIAITCGGWLRLLAGEEQRAPVLLQRIHLEWLWRLSSDKSRTLDRYRLGLVNVIGAISGAWKQSLRGKGRRN